MKHKGKKEQEPLSPFAQYLIEMERARRRAEGRAEGIEECRAEGRAEGRVEGRAEGRVEGIVKGRVEGEAKGEARLMQKYIQNRRNRYLPESQILEDLMSDFELDEAKARQYMEAGLAKA